MRTCRWQRTCCRQRTAQERPRQESWSRSRRGRDGGEELDSAAKVAQLGGAAQAQKYVHALDVAVDDAARVQIIESRRHLSNARQALPRKQLFIAEFVVDGAADHPLHEDEGVVRLHAHAEYSDAARVSHPALHLHLRHEVPQVALGELYLHFGLLQREGRAVLKHAHHLREPALALGRGGVGRDVAPLQVQPQPARHLLVRKGVAGVGEDRRCHNLAIR
jgi:hypothetical protein